MAEKIKFMGNTSDLQHYKKFVRRKLDELTTYLAHISVGDFTKQFNVYELEDDEFAEVFCGLDLMMDDLIEARSELKSINENLEKIVQQRTSELETEKVRLAITLRSIGEGVIATDTTGSIQLMNMAAEEITGWSFKEAKDIPLHKVFCLEGQNDLSFTPHANDNKDIPVESVQIKQGEALLKIKNNRTRAILYSLSPIIDQTNNNVIGRVIAFRDIEEKKRTENELFRMKKLESVGILAGGIAHDFNNILTGIISNLQMALQASTENSEINELLEDAEKASLRAVNLTKQLLTFSKGGVPVKEIASLSELINESVKFCLSGTNINAKLAVPADLWMVEMDKGQINQMFNNIIINAVQAMPDGGTINVSGRNVELKTNKDSIILLDNLKPGKYVEIAVKDNGTGIDAAHINKIFDPYFTTKKKGSGLGLTIAYSIIKGHNSHITATSNPDGSIITIYLPANLSKKPRPRKISKKIEKGYGSILIMDDD